MARYRKILVAYDGSASARNALAEAVGLARLNNCWIKVLAVVPSYEGDLELIGVKNIKKMIQGPGQRLLAEAGELASVQGIRILKNLEQGEPYERIIHVADEENCDLIVMGRRGVTHLERELIGSVTARVIGHTSRDVLVVPEKAAVGWQTILIATDGSPASEAAVEHGLELAAEHKGKAIAVTTVYTNDEYFAMAHEMVHGLIDQAKACLAAVKSKAEECRVPFRKVIKEGEPHQVILSEAVASNVQLIIMGSHGKKGLSRLLMGSATERVIGLAACPVLVVHKQEG